MRNYVSVGNSFDKKKFDEICGLLRRGMCIEPMVSCIGHTLNNMIQNEYRSKLEEEFGDNLDVAYNEGVCSYSYSYKLKVGGVKMDKLYDIFMELVGNLSNEELLELSKSLKEYVENDKLFDKEESE